MGVFRLPWRRPRRAKFVPGKLATGIVQIGKVTGNGRLSPFGRHPNKVLGTGQVGQFTPLTSGGGEGRITESGRRLIATTVDERGNRVIGLGLVTERGERVIKSAGGAGQLTVLIGQVVGVGDARSFLAIDKVIGTGTASTLTAVHVDTPENVLGTGIVQSIRPVRIKNFGKIISTGEATPVTPQGTVANTVLIIKVIGVGVAAPVSTLLETPNWGELLSSTLYTPALTLTSTTEEIGFNEPGES